MDSHIASNYEGYYLINESNIVLHIILESRNDVGAKVINKTFKKYFNTVDEHDISK
ncbi:MAG: hypothetical protein HFJ59_00815 [Clostridia bacterium]|nr:hypothetical protein [Clostridia bacterium]